MPIGFGIPRALVNGVRRLAVWIALEINGFIDRVGEDVANQTIDMIGIGYKQCENPDCRKNTNDWHKCATSGIVYCAECGSFQQCELCLKWYCVDCASDFETLVCCDTRICDPCRRHHDTTDLYWLTCCQEYVCCQREIWYDSDDEYLCDEHVTIPRIVQSYTDENIETRLREQHHDRLMQRMALRQRFRAPTPPDFEYDTDVESD